jgi:hypothetical protein
MCQPPLFEGRGEVVGTFPMAVVDRQYQLLEKLPDLTATDGVVLKPRTHGRRANAYAVPVREVSAVPPREVLIQAAQVSILLRQMYTDRRLFSRERAVWMGLTRRA